MIPDVTDGHRNRAGLPELLLLGVQALVAVVVVFFSYFVGFVSPGCSPTCNYDLFNRINDALRITVAVAFLLSAAFVFVSWVMGKRGRWGAITGIIVTLLAGVIASIAGYGAFAP
ncbi:hypothetical protein [Microbacterium sp. Clip185]|uniref:hypothetical protein n=1 Tax=Microbacterium sp. Clip185 TaxID=3025663 RepID=UPI002365F617|nr:hypothetical protein [Microbacterium sp. Clip185]WDG18079.1 hypothetical protein PQV94_15855 [Microbacterium sp. Clip185]